jgi:hypothetical protein
MVMMAHFSFGQCLSINEIMINGASCDGSCNPNTAEWVELYNDCGSDIDVSCYIISDGDWTYTFPSGTIIPSKGFLTIGGASNEGSAPDLDWATANYSGTGGIGTFTNGGEQLALFDNSGTMIDGIIWGGGQALSASNIPVTTFGSCTVTDIDLPNSGNSGWEDIGGDGTDGSTMSRECDGSSVWVNTETTDMSFGTTNGCIVMTLDTTKAVVTFPTEEGEEKVILTIYNVLGQEVYNLINGKEVNMSHYKGVIIIRYLDGTLRKVEVL